MLGLLLFTSIDTVCVAQYWELGASIGGTGYMGDINPKNPLQYNSIGGGVHVQYNWNPTWGIKTSVSYLPVFSTDQQSNTSYQQQRNLSFRNNIWELSSVATFNLLRYIPDNKKYSFTPYLFAGVGVIHHRPFVWMNGQKIDLMPLQLEQDEHGQIVQYSSWGMSIPFGAGFKKSFRGVWSVGVDISYRAAFTNSLDNVSGYYRSTADYPSEADIVPSKWEYLADPSNRLNSNTGLLRGNGKQRDGYMSAMVTIQYNLLSSKCYFW